ncbi:basal body-orientation factor 1-like [Nematolebias whitei]|uniref:basal body-orientation factor 1-like n=1 Tax=Nematolebias whitei TaxID=451745 RepID=UPI0018976FD7|nr:basal body-orientation factor 1-like [Nematolebias whitei]
MPTPKAPKMKRIKGKGKKTSKQHDSKLEKESDVDTVRVNAALWGLRLKVTDQDLSEYREAHHNLTRVNEQLSTQLYRAEKDSIDMTGYWQKHVEERDDKIINLEDSLKRQENLLHKEKNKMAQEFNVIRGEMSKLKETIAHRELELSVMREKMEMAADEHQENLVNTEDNFQKEKARLQEELEKQHSREMDRLKLDHRVAVAQLEGALRSAFEEHSHLNETLTNTMKEAEDLKKLTHSLVEKNNSLALEKDMHELTAKNAAAKMGDLKKNLSEHMAKNASLEQALQQMEAKLEQQEEKEKMNLVTIQASQVELDKLQKVLHMREEEMKHVKQLACIVVDKRKEVENFFHEALAHVREEIDASRLHYKKEALRDYQRRLREATAGKIKFPPIRTFNKNPNSTSSVYADMEATAKWPYPAGSEVHVSDLTWEQKEQVLSLLFAKMNGQAERKHYHHQANCASSEEQKSPS